MYVLLFIYKCNNQYVHDDSLEIYINAGTISHITLFTSTHSLTSWSSMSHKFEIVMCNFWEFMW